ncbi:uncharacterized protein LOC133791682 [Humulus lupulus]|uniref:uncharacterized protein LOC133791682 n=1 Tax=Humulus lupulus TaxID=3486 RepID=UPI002B4004D6|nr:uncharacterized protein LOC133791682 [Humulus lupulus]
MEQAIEFEWLPTRCSCCKCLGHTASSCKHAQEVVWKSKQKVTISEKGESRGATELCESGLENKPMDVNQMVAGKEAQTTSKGDQLAVKGDLKATLITTNEEINEASCSMTGKDKPWSTPKKVGGLRKKGSFLETKLHSNKVEEMMHDVFVGWRWYISRAVEGRILLVWNQDLVHVAISQEQDQLINCEVQIKGVNQIANLSFMQVTAMEVEDSSQWRAKSLLIELRSSGSFFTWSNKQKEGSRIFSKLDRVFVNEMWLDIFPNSEARVNWDAIYDHCFCIIKTVQFQTTGVRPFRYYNMWDKHKDFRSTVVNIWTKPAGGIGLQKIIKKLRRLKPALI